MWCSAIGYHRHAPPEPARGAACRRGAAVGKVWRIGVLMGLPRETPRYAPFHQGLREFG